MRSRLFNFDTSTGRATELGSAFIVVLSLITLVMDTAVDGGSVAHTWLRRAEFVFWVIFSVEYLLRIYAAPRRFRYIRSFYGIVDLLAVVAGITAILTLAAAKPLRILRVLRILKVARFSSAVERFSDAYDDIKDELGLFLCVTAILSFVGAYGIWEFEHEANEAYGNLFEGVYWAVASLTMGGAEGIAPATVQGKVLAMLMVMIGLGIVAVPSGLVASALSRTNPVPPVSPGNQDTI
ncbi:MAG: ion transporter [bacterium]|nr:ion transporter [bacterium]